jgi:RNA polymerase sigma-70 factor (ECF subfamily)
MTETLPFPIAMEAQLRRAIEGDRDAFDQLLSEHLDRLEYYVRLRLGEHLRQAVEVDDILQETALRAYRSIGRFRPQGEGSFLRWLKSVAEHVILEAASRDGKHRAEPLEDGRAADSPSQATLIQREERFARLQAAFDALPRDERQVILLARLQSLPIALVAEKLGRSPAAAKQLLWRALRRLRSAFGETASFHLPNRRLDEEGGAGEPR